MEIAKSVRESFPVFSPFSSFPHLLEPGKKGKQLGKADKGKGEENWMWTAPLEAPRSGHQRELQPHCRLEGGCLGGPISLVLVPHRISVLIPAWPLLQMLPDCVCNNQGSQHLHCWKQPCFNERSLGPERPQRTCA